MTSAADLIAALNQKRKLLSLRPEMPGELPPGWQRWLDAIPVVDGAAANAKPQPWVDAFLQRPLRAIPRSPPMLGRWQAALRLLQQEWEPDPRDERGLRIGVGVVDLLLHLVLVALLFWLVYLGFMATAQPQEEDETVQVEFIGRGNVAEGGGAIANAGAGSAPADAAPATRASTPAPATGHPDAPVASRAAPSPSQVAASNDAPEQDTSPPAVAETAQVLQVTEVAAPAPRAFQLPPPKPRDTPQPRLQVREVRPRQQVEEITTLRTQPQRTLQPRETLTEVLVPQLRQAPQALDVPAPQRMATLPARVTPSPATSPSQIEVPQLRGEVREIPMPPGGAPTPSKPAGSGTASQATASAPGAGGERGTAPAAGQSQAGKGQGARPAEQGGRGVTTAGSGAGPASKPAPGGWPGPAKTDDWGASKRNVAGTDNGRGQDVDGKPGLFNDDGRPRLADEWTRQTGIDVDRAGTWLKRPGLEYRGTRFDRYWIPQGSLLQEWVRRGVRKVSIPIPGSKVRLECVVSLLQLGGGCFPVNPDVNEQPARARPPPDIPFKPELQEDNGSVRPIP